MNLHATACPKRMHACDYRDAKMNQYMWYIVVYLTGCFDDGRKIEAEGNNSIAGGTKDGNLRDHRNVRAQP